MTWSYFQLAMDIVWPPMCALIVLSLFRLLRLPWRSRLDPIAWPWLCGAIGNVIGAASWPLVTVCAVQAGIALAIWWWRKRRRDRAPKFAGAKSRARIAALVATLRESLRPRPILRPQPGGASLGSGEQEPEVAVAAQSDECGQVHEGCSLVSPRR